ncbi:hypothetical protein ACWEV4_28910 [Streptomyces sp. NPDC003860]
MSSTTADVDHVLAYPEPPASPLWHRHGDQGRPPLTDAQRLRNRELLVLTQHSPRPRTPHTTNTRAEAQG